MPKMLFTDNAKTTMSGSLPQGGTALVVSSGGGNKFPSPTGGDWAEITLYQKDVGGNEINVEVVKLVSRITDTLNITRDINNLTGNSGGYAYPGTDGTVYVELRMTANSANAMAQTGMNLADLSNVASARANLGLGSAATKDVGTTAGDVAAGNHTHASLDSHISNTSNPHGVSRSQIGAAASGANSDISSLSGLTTPLSIAQGGTGGNSQAAARAALGLGDVAVKTVGTGAGQVPTADQVPGLVSGLPSGAVAFFAMATAPGGWLKANGAAVSRTTYASLFSAIGTMFGAGDGSTTFNLPDLRGEFLRGFDDGRGLDAGRSLGTVQGSQNLSHAHGAGSLYAVYNGDHTHTGGSPNGSNQSTTLLVGQTYVNGAVVPTSTAGGHTHSVAGATGADGGAEARPRNMALLACIKV